jgi:hypothetical protein
VDLLWGRGSGAARDVRSVREEQRRRSRHGLLVGARRREVRRRAGGAIWGGTGDECVGCRLFCSARAQEVRLECARLEEFRILLAAFEARGSSFLD